MSRPWASRRATRRGSDASRPRTGPPRRRNSAARTPDASAHCAFPRLQAESWSRRRLQQESPLLSMDMNVLFVTPECAPLVKTGGLGDVSAALPPALKDQGVDVRVLLPGYTAVLDALGDAAEIARIEVLGHDIRL